MVTKKQEQYEHNLKLLNDFIESLYYPKVAATEFKAVRNRFAQLFPEFAPENIEEKRKESLTLDAEAAQLRVDLKSLMMEGVLS